MKNLSDKEKMILLIGAAVLLVIIGAGASSLINGLIPTVKSEVVTSTKTIEESVRELSELITLTYGYTDVITHSDKKVAEVFGKNFSIPFGKKSFIFTYDGEMKIGINMEQVSVITEEGLITVVYAAGENHFACY